MSANPIDLTTLAAIKSWAGVTSATEDATIQDAITAFSAHILHLTGRGPADGSIPSASPFNSSVAYDEFYDGNGNDRLPLRNWPIQSVVSVSDTGITIPASTSVTQPGYVVDQSKKFLVLRFGGNAYARWPRGYRRNCGWTLGTQNVEVSYTAGFASVPIDLDMLARKVVARTYKGRGWIGQKAQMMAAGAGTVTYTDWIMDEQDKAVVEYYKRRTA